MSKFALPSKILDIAYVLGRNTRKKLKTATAPKPLATASILKNTPTRHRYTAENKHYA